MGECLHQSIQLALEALRSKADDARVAAAEEQTKKARETARAAVDADWLSWRDVDVATMTYSAVVAVVFAPLVVGVVAIAAYSRRARRRRS